MAFAFKQIKIFLLLFCSQISLALSVLLFICVISAKLRSERLITLLWWKKETERRSIAVCARKWRKQYKVFLLLNLFLLVLLKKNLIKCQGWIILSHITHFSKKNLSEIVFQKTCHIFDESYDWPNFPLVTHKSLRTFHTHNDLHSFQNFSPKLFRARNFRRHETYRKKDDDGVKFVSRFKMQDFSISFLLPAATAYTIHVNLHTCVWCCEEQLLAKV